jgi:hypothetical protein
MTGWLTALRDRPIPERQRHNALAVTTVLLVAATVLLTLTRPTQHTPARPHRAQATIAAGVRSATDAPSPEAIAAARGFLTGYLAYTYGRAPATEITHATHALARSLQAHPPRMTPGMRASRPHVLELHTTTIGPTVLSVRALVNDGGLVNYSVGLLLEAYDGRLLVSALEQD